ncbi:hypothetical protein [Kordiimonas sp.]|uniref:hypothetical protein n=1 Tax=Kordiimonas sp. TaxID=1970157 RepID=UPI003A900EA5
MIFAVTPDHIASLSDTDLRTLVALLCVREINNAGLSTASVTWGGHQNASDGGIDVRVDLDVGADITGYVPRPNTGIQVKATDMPRAAIIKEMRPDGKLLDSIKELGRQNGAYIIAGSQGSYSNTALTNRRNAMSEALVGEPEAENLAIDFYDQQRLTTWVNQHPGVVTWVLQRTGHALSGWQPFGDWSSSPTSIDAEYFADDKVRLLRARVSDDSSLGTTEGINTIRSILREPKSAIRLVGLSGVGKTRLAQALFDNRIGENALDQTLAIYTDISDAPDPVPMDLLSRLIENNQNAILIIDNCGIDLHKKLSARINKAQSKLSLLTIEYDIRDDEPENTDVFKLEAVTDDLIEQILESRFPALSRPERSKIAEFSTGNARIAFALANTSKHGETLAHMHDSELFARLFHQNNVIDQNLLSAAKACALVYSYDGETLEGEGSELPALAALVGQSPQEFYRHTAELFRRQLVQKRNKWRAVLPHALAHHLAKLALEDIPYDQISSNIINGSSGRLLRSFSRRIGFLHDTEPAKTLARSWLQEGGLLGDLGLLNSLGEALLGNVAPINPQLTLAYIEEASQKQSDFYTDANSNRRTITNILRSLAYEPICFERSIALLAGFARHENRDRNNTQDASQILPTLFHLYLSGTHASATQRAQTIRQLFDSGDLKDNGLGLAALEAMLKTNHFSSHYGFEFGARARNYGYHPTTNQEIASWYSEALDVVAEYGASNHPLASKIKELFAGKVRSMSCRAHLIDKAIAVSDKLAENDGWPLGWVGIRYAIKMSPKNMPNEELQKLEALADRLAPRSLRDMIRSHALTREWGRLDIAELDDEEDQPLKARERIFDICRDLGRQLAQAHSDLDAMLPEIVASDSNKIWSVGKGLAEGCDSVEAMWGKIVAVTFPGDQDANNASLLAGFVAAASSLDTEAIERLLERALEDRRFHKHLVYLQVNSGMTERGVARLHEAVKRDSVPSYSFRNLALGGISREVPDHELGEILDALSDRDDGLGDAIDVFGMRLHGMVDANEEVNDALKLIGQMLISKLTFKKRSDREDYDLGKIIKMCLGSPQCEPIVRAVCEKFWDAVHRGDAYVWHFKYLVDALTLTHPTTTLDIFVGQSDDRYMRRRTFFSDLREDRSDNPLANVPDKIMMEWVELEPEVRSCQLAQAVRYSTQKKDQNTECKWTPIAMKLITQSPRPLEVLNTFYDRFSPMSWSGPRSAVLAQRVPLLRQLMDNKDPEIVNWANATLPDYEKIIAEERKYEAERDRDRDEKFEW